MLMRLDLYLSTTKLRGDIPAAIPILSSIEDVETPPSKRKRRVGWFKLHRD